jgi:EPS-associated MarR family transcriptional regulator
MNEQSLEKQILNILRILSSQENLTQRDLSAHLGISLGKTNYLLKELLKIGLLEIKNFATKGSKAQKVRYYLTKEGIEERLRLTQHFLKEKEAEYYNIRKEWEDLNSKRTEAFATAKESE